MSILVQIVVDNMRCYQCNRKAPNLLLITPKGKALLKEENKNNPLLPESAIDSGSFLSGADMLTVGDNDLEGGIYKWIYTEKK